MIKKQLTLGEQAANSLLEYFKENNFKTGDRIPNEYKLAEILNIGRSTLREAVKMLSSKEMVEVKQGSGTYIRTLVDPSQDPLGFSQYDMSESIKLTKDLFEVRFLIEPRMASLAAKNISDDEILILKQLMVAIEEDLKLDKELHRELDVQFHSAIAEASRNHAMKQLVPIVLQSITLYNQYFTDQESKERTIKAHREIFEAIAAHDSERAYDAMVAHMAMNRLRINQ
ncbi:MAG: FadR/GntR family transcriptional regulator [Streptococcus sp.]|nr:FadR/GntR family transcriptional regulator [Streptococcus sp.]